MAKIMFNNLSAYAQAKFGSEDRFEGFRNLGNDLAMGRTIYDADGNQIDKRDADKTYRKMMLDFLGLPENASKRDRKRAFRAHKDELFQVIEDTIEMKIDEGFHATEWFNSLVEERNLALGDSVQFWSEKKCYLSVARTSGSHHDVTVQRLQPGQNFSVEMSTWTIKVGCDIDLFLSGRVAWDVLTNEAANAFVRHVQSLVYTAITEASKSLPTQMKGTGALSTATKDSFDKILDNVSMANDGAEVYILGTKSALRKLTGLADVDWASSGQKEEMATLGRLGSYEGTRLVEVPNRFAIGDLSKTLVADDKLFIFGSNDKFVKYVTEGDTTITEVTEKGMANGHMDDTMDQQIERTYGAAVILGAYFGEWTITA